MRWENFSSHKKNVSVYKIQPQLFIKLGFKYQKQNIIAVLKTSHQLCVSNELLSLI